MIDLTATRPLVALALANNHGQCINILDFGGACGHHYFTTRALLGDSIPLKWNVVETKAMVASARQFGNEHLRFFDSLPAAVDAMSGIDLLFSSGALQYVPDPIVMLRELLQCGAQQLFFTRVGLSISNQATVSVQVSNLSDIGPGPPPTGFENRTVQYPVTFEPKKIFEETIATRYNIDAVSTEDQDAYPGNQEKIHLYGYYARA